MCPRCVHCFVSLLLQKLANFPLTWFLTLPSIRYPYCPGFFHSPFHSSLHGPQGPQVKRLKFEINYVTCSCASKGPLRCRQWTCESSPTIGHHVGYSEINFLILFVQQCITIMFSSSSAPTCIASIRKSGCSRYQPGPVSDPRDHVDEKITQLRCALCVFMPSSLPS